MSLTSRVKEFFINQDDLQEPRSRADEIMTDEEKEIGQYFLEEYNMRTADTQAYIEEWDELSKMYRCERDKTNPDPSFPNSFIAMLTPAVEGQVASMTESGIEFTCQSREPGAEPFMSMLDAAGEYVREANRFVSNFKDYGRNYEVFGNSFVEVSWEKDLYVSKTTPGGYPHVSIPDIRDILVDGKITDYKDLQRSEYIIHRKGLHSIGWARRRYGDDVANAIATGVGAQYDAEENVNYDQRNAFVLLHVWTRKNEYNNVQLIEMDENGFVLKMSDPKKPYYTKTMNQYPFFMSRMIPQLGCLYGIGDGKLLAPAQDVVNKLTDELTIAAKFSAQAKWAIDPRGKAKMSQINSDPSKPFLIENPNTNIRVIQASGVNAVVFNYIQFLLEQAQRMTRYHDIMSGNIQGSSATATQINTQVMQGSVGINDKKTDISEAMAWAYKYCLQLCLQYWDVPMWSKLGKEHEWVDFDFIKQVPSVVPITPEEVNRMSDMGVKPPKYQQLRKKGSKKMVKHDIEFQVRVIIGQGIPKGRIDIFNMIVQLLQIPMGNNPDGSIKPLIDPDKAREMLEEVLGFTLTATSDEDNTNLIQQTIANAMNQNPLGGNGVQPQQGAQQGVVPNNLAATVPGMGDKRGML